VLASCSYDDTVRIWQEDNDDWYCAATLTGHTSTVWGIAFDPTGDRLGTMHTHTHTHTFTQSHMHTYKQTRVC
jgi:WD40 repeat protein